MAGYILVVGSLNMDLVVRTPHHPHIGETVFGYDFKTFPGGKGANQAVAAARMGSPVRMIGRVGSDAFGERLLATVSEAGVDIQSIFRDDNEPTGVALITVDGGGQNTIVVASGANMHLTPQDIESAEQIFREAAIVLVQLEIPLDTVASAIRLAHKENARVVLNPAPAQVLETDLLKQVDYLIPNQTELELLTGQDNVEAAIKALHGRGIQNLVVTLGEMGALVATPESHARIPGYHVQAVDTTAAGDAFAGGFAVALQEGYDIFEAAAWGNASGALAVMRIGAQPSLPTRAEFEHFRIEHSTP